MFTVVSDNTVVFLNVPFAEANRLAKVERALGSKVVVRRTTQADVDANDAHLAEVSALLSRGWDSIHESNREFEDEAARDQLDSDAMDSIEHILSQRTRSTMTSTGWVRNNVAYGATML